jgi:hypothetical protein
VTSIGGLAAKQNKLGNKPGFDKLWIPFNNCAVHHTSEQHPFHLKLSAEIGCDIFHTSDDIVQQRCQN